MNSVSAYKMATFLDRQVTHVARKSILHALAYFDIFHYPLEKAEIQEFSGLILDEHSLDDALISLVNEKIIFNHHGYYSLEDNPLLGIRRKDGNQRAQLLLKKAHRIGRFLHLFPFVRAVAISGSLSKNFADEKADIDFFVITSSNRLWIARTLMHIFKKFTFLVARQHYFCMNYYLDEQNMLLPDQNIFVAIELKTLVPAKGNKALSKLFYINSWVDQYLPAHTTNMRPEIDKPDNWLKRIVENFFPGSFGNWLDDLLFRITSQRWARKLARGVRNQKGLTMDMITNKHFARSNPDGFQEKVLALYTEKIKAATSKLMDAE